MLLRNPYVFSLIHSVVRDTDIEQGCISGALMLRRKPGVVVGRPGVCTSSWLQPAWVVQCTATPSL